MAELQARSGEVEGNGDLSLASSRLDGALLRYVLMFRSRMNMLVLDREVRALVGAQGLLTLSPGITRSSLLFRAEATMQFAAELALAQPYVVRWVRGDALRRQMTIDAAYYQADRWSRGLPPALALPRFKAAGEEDADQPTGPLREFVMYLWRSSRLDEEPREKQVSREADDLPDEGLREDEDVFDGPDDSDELDYELPLSPMVSDVPLPPLPAMALRRLRVEGAHRIMRNIARDVARRLTDMTGLAEWRQAAAVCSGNAGFRRPPPELFDALLLSQNALIRVHPSSSRRDWQFSATGMRRFLPFDLQQPELDAVQGQRFEIEQADEILAGLLSLEGGRAFCWLADVFSLLPTTPAWADVDRAMAALAARSERRTLATSRAGDFQHEEKLAEELRTVAEFHRLASANFGTVARALRVAVLLHAVADLESSGASSTLQTLRQLASGLRFAETDLPAIDEKLDRVWEALAPPIPDDLNDAATVDDVVLTLTTRAQRLGQFLSRIRVAVRQPDYRFHSPKLTDARDDARVRLAAWVTTANAGDASPAELRDAVTNAGVMRWLRLDPRRMTLKDWSSALVTAATEYEAPPWLAVIALQRLGANTLSRVQQQRLLDALVALEKTRDAPSHAVDVARRDGVWRSDPQGVGTLILLRRAGSLLNDGWFRPPTRGLIVPLTETEAWRLLLHRGLLRALPQPLRVLVEGEPEDVKPLRQMMARLGSASRGEKWLDRQRRQWRLRATSERVLARPHAVNPDDLFGAAVPEDRPGA